MSYENLDPKIQQRLAADEEHQETLRRIEAITASFDEIHRKREAEEDTFPEPEVLDAELDSVRVRIPGYKTPVSIELHFADTKDRTSDENHTAFLQSDMTMGDFYLNGGKAVYIFPQGAEMEKQDEMRRESEQTPLNNDNGREDIYDYELEKAYGMPRVAIRKAFKFGERYLINQLRNRAGKPPLPPERRVTPKPTTVDLPYPKA